MSADTRTDQELLNAARNGDEGQEECGKKPAA